MGIPGCMYGWCCAPCVYGETHAIMGTGSCCMAAASVMLCSPCVVCCQAPGRRTGMRGALGNLPAEPCGTHNRNPLPSNPLGTFLPSPYLIKSNCPLARHHEIEMAS